MITIHLMNTSIVKPEIFSKRLRTLSELRQNKVDSFRFMKDKLLSFCAGLLADDFLLQNYGLSERDSGFRYDCNGKPCFSNLPELNVSFSHSENIALAVFSDNGQVGCDAEQITNYNSPVTNELAKHFFTAEEQAEIHCGEDFFRIWTRKEAAFKLGLKDYFTLEYKIKDYFITVCSEKQEDCIIYNGGSPLFSSYTK
jgi:phosphopantetheinyl transferase